MNKKFFVFLFFMTLKNVAFSMDLYEVGKKAFDEGDYVVALKNLYAYQQMNADKLSQLPDFSKALDRTIHKAEKGLITRSGCIRGYNDEESDLWAAGSTPPKKPNPDSVSRKIHGAAAVGVPPSLENSDNKN